MSNLELNNFFRTKVEKTVKNQGVRFSDITVEYLAHLLYSTSFDSDIKNIYLFDIYNKAVNAKSQLEQYEFYRYLGDHTLIVTGYFPESLNSKIVDKEYYISMGKLAYGSLSHYSGPYKEIAYKYNQCVSVFNEISELNKFHNFSNIPGLYEMWLSTKSSAIKGLLTELGMITVEIEE